MSIFTSFKSFAVGAVLAILAPAANAAVVPATVGPMTVYADLNIYGEYQYTLGANDTLEIYGAAFLDYLLPDLDAVRDYYLLTSFEIGLDTDKGPFTIAAGSDSTHVGLTNVGFLFAALAGLPVADGGSGIGVLLEYYDLVVTDNGDGSSRASAGVHVVLEGAAAGGLLALVGLDPFVEDSTGSFEINSRLVAKTPAAVPLPAAGLLLGLGLAGLGAVRRRKSTVA